MSNHARRIDKRMHDVRESESGSLDSDHRRLDVGHRYRIAPPGNVPALRLQLLFTNGNTLELNYSHITERYFLRHDIREERNVILIRIRDSMQITTAGFNLWRLNDDLLMQRVVEIGSVTLQHAEAALKVEPETPVITNIKLEYGRMDVENGQWLPGHGSWSDEEQRWIPHPIPMS